ncbi:MAG TPA: AAA domain-containing protein [Thermomicrobiales bacterium]|nr:AAA domain-containing protein [Thermomicrobiales bacterium]
MSNSRFPRPIDPDGQRKLAPTDISQFIRLDQCDRYLRLRLHERAFGQRFMREYDVTPQSIPALLTRSGSVFEMKTESTVANHFPIENYAARDHESGSRQADNERLIGAIRDLEPDSVFVVFQPRLEVDVDGWMIRGDVDILRLERDVAGRLTITIADMKSSRSAKVEHRVQVAFYHAMLTRLLATHAIETDTIRMAILYRGPSEADDAQLDDEERQRREAQRAAARELFGVTDALLEIVEDPEHYLRAVEDLVTGKDSRAIRVAEAPFDHVPYHLTYKCDGCIYSEFCMKWSAERDDLSLIPHLTIQQKSSLRRAGITTTSQLAALKQPVADDPNTLQPAPGHEAQTRALAATWPVGPRLDELIHRARRYRKYVKDPIEAISYLPSKGYGSLPYTDASHNPNLVRIYIDAQHDYLNDRVYLLGALLVGCEDGVESPERRKSVVMMSDGPPATAEDERHLLVGWIGGVLATLEEVAAPNEEGLPKAPIHLIFYDRMQQTMLLDALSRHFASIVEATPLFDFITQIAAFDSPVATFLEDEIRELKNYPMVCQSLQSVAAYLRFDWNQPEEYRRLFSVRLFDFWGKLEQENGEMAWYTNRARFNSMIPLEYAYAAWGDLDVPADADPGEYRRFGGVDATLIQGFQRRRLEALEHIARDFRGNKQTVKSAFDIPNLAEFDDRSREMANALREFLTIERHTELTAWKNARLAPPERRVLAGDTLLVRYVEADQEPGVAALNRDNRRRMELREKYRAAYAAEHPDASRITLPKEQRQESDWSQDGIGFWLRVETDGVDCDLEEILSLTSFRERDSLVLFPRWAVDSRLPEDERYEFTPTPKQLLYGMRVILKQIVIDRPAGGRAKSARVLVEMQNGQGRGQNGFVFGTTPFNNLPLEQGKVYTLDSNPTDWYGSHCVEVVKGLIEGGVNTLFDWLSDTAALAGARHDWPLAAAEGQRRFLAGLDALGAAGALHGFEPGKRDYIAGHGDAPILLVQGPPGTGKSYSTAFAIFARIQGAMAAGIPFRVFLTCKTHAATDVLLDNVLNVQRKLADWFIEQPEIAEQFFDRRLTQVPLFRIRPRGDVAGLIVPLLDDRNKPAGKKAIDQIMAQEWAIVAAAPAGTRSAIKDKWSKEIFGHEVADCLILDEASQMNLPEAILAGLPLKQDGQLIVVGDHRQMPPIVKHDWSSEPRRTFQEYRSYESLFEALLPVGLPIIRFEESFRLHAEMAEFLRREIYQHDQIPFHSKRTTTLGPIAHNDPFVAAVLDPAYPLVVIVHDEAGSQLQNDCERELITPVLHALATIPLVNGHDNLPRNGLDPYVGLGVVVPHRAQRAAFIEHVPSVTERDKDTGTIRKSAVDTVERFQGDERQVIVYTATESDPQYLVAASKFLMDPRRLTVALSRAKSKIIVVASRSVFSIFSADEETFANAQLWKNLLRETCIVPLWSGPRTANGVEVGVEVWGNQPGVTQQALTP